MPGFLTLGTRDLGRLARDLVRHAQGLVRPPTPPDCPTAAFVVRSACAVEWGEYAALCIKRTKATYWASGEFECVHPALLIAIAVGIALLLAVVTYNVVFAL